MIQIYGTVRITLQNKSYLSKYFRPLLNLGDSMFVSSLITDNNVELKTDSPVAVVLNLFTLDDEDLPEVNTRINGSKHIAVQESPKKLVGYMEIEKIVLA